jgi:hypothetical protein
MLIDRPEVDPEGREGGTAELGEIAFRSEIIFCRLVKASPLPSFSTSFFFASSRAASKAVRGGDTCACRTRGWDSERVELAETDRGGALVSIGWGRLPSCCFFLFPLFGFLVSFFSPPTFPSSLFTGEPNLTPPPIVVVFPLLTRLLPSPREECEFDRDVPPDLLPFERPRREELELAEEGREIWEGGARVAPDDGLGLAVGSGDVMVEEYDRECTRGRLLVCL